MRKLSLLILLAATQIGATDCGQVLRDPGFDLWCGGDLCTWKVVRGDVRRVDTWHEGDSGVELLGDDAAISQVSPVNNFDGTCIRFDLVANVASNAEARLDIDIYGDGTVERTERIPTANWKPLSYKLRIASPYTGIRFELAKTGPGTAVFAQIAAEIDGGCDGLTEIKAAAAPLGAICVDDASCESGRCRTINTGKRCVGCDGSSCGTGETCGVGDPISPVLSVPIECVPTAGDELGEQCIANAECASGICNRGACSTCDATHPCTNGETCGEAWPLGPSVCAPAAGLRASGQPCATDADCASARCNGGVRKACSDNRPCFSDTNCPVDAGLVPGTCTTVGVQGGSCQ